MSALLNRAPRPTAAVCFNDVVAVGAMQALVSHGLVAGRDMAITGFDDTVEAAQVSPLLTTVAVDPGDLGHQAAALLLRRIEGGSDPAETYLGEARLVIRQSCGATPDPRKIA